MSDEHLAHLLDTNDTPLSLPVFTGVRTATIADYEMKETPAGPILSITLKLEEPVTSTDGKEFPAGHIIIKQIRFIPSGKWTVDNAKQEVRKLQIAALQKPFASTEQLPPLTETNKEIYIGKQVEAHLKVRMVQQDGEMIGYQDVRFRRLEQDA